MKPALARSQAFTLLELLVVLLMLALLTLTLLPGLAATRNRNNRIGCLNNLRQMGAGSQMYSEDDSQGRLTGSLATSPNVVQADDDLNWLYPRYITTLDTFICPATHNAINHSSPADFLVDGRLLDLAYKASGTNSDFARGHSYEVFGSWYDQPTFTRKTARTVLSYRNKVRPDPGGPAGIFIILDQVDQHRPQWPYENVPNAYNNHGESGAHVAFADGHAAWVPRERWQDAITRSDDYPTSWKFPPDY